MRQDRADEITALTAFMLDALEAAAAANNNAPFSRSTAEPGMTSMATGIVDWIRAREDEDIEIDLSGVTVSGSDLVGTGTIT